MTKTKINGEWIQDPIKDYSNGSKPKTQPTQDCTKLQAELTRVKAQALRMSNLLQELSRMSNSKDMRQLIVAAKQRAKTIK